MQHIYLTEQHLKLTSTVCTAFSYCLRCSQRKQFDLFRPQRKLLAKVFLVVSVYVRPVAHRAMRAKNFPFLYEDGPTQDCHGCQMIGTMVQNQPLFAESATMHLFLQNGHFSTLKWPFLTIKNNSNTICLSKGVFLGF